MGVLAWVLFGLLAGAVAQIIVPGPAGRGCLAIIGTILAGILGAIVGGFISAAAGFGGITGFDVRSFLIAVLGAVLVLYLWRALSGRRGRLL